MKRLFLILFLLFPSLAHAASYSTAFTATENPISESSNWINGRATGLDWQNIRTTPGFAFPVVGNPIEAGYDDITAILAGTWSSNQYVRVVIKLPAADPS